MENHVHLGFCREVTYLSWTVSRWPALRRLLAMWPPMLPRPINPTSCNPSHHIANHHIWSKDFTYAGSSNTWQVSCITYTITSSSRTLSLHLQMHLNGLSLQIILLKKVHRFTLNKCTSSITVHIQVVGFCVLFHLNYTVRTCWRKSEAYRLPRRWAKLAPHWRPYHPLRSNPHMSQKRHRHPRSQFKSFEKRKETPQT